MKNKKKIKNFFKSKTGNYAIIAIGVIPVVLGLVSSIVCDKRNKSIYENEIKASIGSFFEYENKVNARVLRKQDNEGNSIEMCNYTTTNRGKIEADFETYFKQIDGYNELWKYDAIEYKEENGSQFISFKCYAYIPKLNTLKVIDYWGICNGDYQTTDGYYKEHQNTMTENFNHKPNENSDWKKYWQEIIIEVDSSCV